MKRRSVWTKAIILMFLFLCAFSWFAMAADETQVRIHYKPTDGDQTPWFLWVWTDDTEGKAVAFNGTDEYGKLASFTLPAGVEQVNYIVRTDDWKKDCEEDRSLEVVDGLAEVWLMSGTCDTAPSPLADTAMLAVMPSAMPDTGMGGSTMNATLPAVALLALLLAGRLMWRARKNKRND